MRLMTVKAERGVGKVALISALTLREPSVEAASTVESGVAGGYQYDPILQL